MVSFRCMSAIVHILGVDGVTTGTLISLALINCHFQQSAVFCMLCNLFLSQPHFAFSSLWCCSSSSDLLFEDVLFLAITICPFNVLYNSSLNMINFASWCFPMTSTVLLELIVSEQWSRHSPDNEFMQLLVCRLNQSAKKHVMYIAVLIGSEGEYFFPFVDPVIKKCAYVVKWCPTKVIMCRERGKEECGFFEALLRLCTAKNIRSQWEWRDHASAELSTVHVSDLCVSPAFLFAEDSMLPSCTPLLHLMG